VGTLDGSENAEIRARVTGYLLKRAYQEGAMVKKGDLLFEIDSRPFEAALAEARSQLEQGKAVQLASQSEADRNKELFTKKVISETEYINKTQTNESNLAKVQALKAAVEQAQLNVQFCKITSPIDGIVGNAKAQVGDLVGQGANAVLTTVSTVDPIKILFPISEQEYLEAAEKIQQIVAKPFEEREQIFEVVLANGTTFEHKGRPLSLDRQVNQATGTILITALVDNPGGLLRPGQFARARIKAKDLPAAIVVPQRAVSELQGMYQVGVIGPDNKAEIRTVKVGPRAGSVWAIESGVKPGEKVVVEGFQKLRANALVVPKLWTPPVAAASAPANPAEAAPKTEPR
jgi:membrane fusion protein (multidrug efflux system)